MTKQLLQVNEFRYDGGNAGQCRRDAIGKRSNHGTKARSPYWHQEDPGAMPVCDNTDPVLHWMAI